MKNPFRKKTRSAIAYYVNDLDDSYIPGYTSFKDCDEVKRCVNIIADCVSNMTIMLMGNTSKAGDERIRNSLSRFLDIEPCKYMTRKTFVKQIVNDLYFNGNAVVLPEYGPDGYLTNLQPLVADRLSFVGDVNNTSYKILYNGITLMPDEVLHFVLRPHRTMPYKGVDCAYSLTNTIKNLAQANKTKTGFLRSEWKPSLIISVSADIEDLRDPEKREKILGSYLDTTKAGDPWLIPAGEIDVKEIRPLTLNDLAIQDGINLDITSIAADLGVPSFLVGIGDYNQEQYNNFVGTTVMFVATVLQQELTKKIIYNPAWHVKFNNKSLMQYKPSEKIKMTEPLIKLGVVSRNEGRAEFDYSPVDNPAMDEFEVLENFIPIDRLGDQLKLKGEEDE